MSQEIKKLICRVIARVNYLTRYAFVRSKIDDSGDKQIIFMVEMGGKNTQGQAIYPYGFSAKCPVGTKLIRFLNSGFANDPCAIPFMQDKRFRDLEDGEVAVGNPITRAYIKFSENGNIVIETTGNVEVKANEVNVDATKVNLGTGGQPIARVGDSVDVGGNPGTITSGGANTSI